MDITKLIQKHNKFYLYYPTEIFRDVIVFSVWFFFVLLILYTSLLTHNYIPTSISFFMFASFMLYTLIRQKYKLSKISSEIEFVKSNCDIMLKTSLSFVSNLNEECLNYFHLNKVKSFKLEIDSYSDKVKNLKIETDNDIIELVELEKNVVELKTSVINFIKRLKK